MKQNPRRLILTLVLSLVLTLVALVPASAANPSGKVLPPGPRYFGRTYAEWSVQWWRWAFSQGATHNALTDLTGADCGSSQSGPVFFLAGSPSTAAITRNCNVPPGKGLFFPIINVEESRVEYVRDGNDMTGGTYADWLALVSGVVNTTYLTEVEIDGRPVQPANAVLTRYRTQTPANPVPTANIAVGNAWGITPGPTEFAADGYYVMVAPLSAGRHTIHFRGAFMFFGTLFTNEVTYNLMVGSK